MEQQHKKLTLIKKHKYRKYKQNKTQQNFQNFVEQSRLAKREVQKAKRDYEESIALKISDDPKKFFSYVNSRKLNKKSDINLENERAEKISNNIEVAEILNNYFISVFTAEDQSNIPVVENCVNNENSLKYIDVTNSDIISAIKKLKPTKSPGPDQIYAKTLLEMKDNLSDHLKILFKKSIDSGFVPDYWKLANVTAIHKKGNKLKPDNYRPISLTSLIGKILETIIRNKIVDHLDKHNLINNSQHGFRKNVSCLTKLLDFYDKLVTAHNNVKSVDIIYLDFKKAFDKVAHLRLLTKLESLGIKGNVHNWIKNWLTG